MVRRLAAVHHVPESEVAGKPDSAIDAALPGVRDAYERRHGIAQDRRAKLGIRTDTVAYRVAHRDSQALLAQLDELGGATT